LRASWLGDQVRKKIYPDRIACWPSTLVLTEFSIFSDFFQLFPNFAMAIIPRSSIPIPLRSGCLNRGSSPSPVVQKILKFCQLGFPRSRKTVARRMVLLSTSSSLPIPLLDRRDKTAALMSLASSSLIHGCRKKDSTAFPIQTVQNRLNRSIRAALRPHRTRAFPLCSR
jgi:hypothetical protein